MGYCPQLDSLLKESWWQICVPTERFSQRPSPVSFCQSDAQCVWHSQVECMCGNTQYLFVYNGSLSFLDRLHYPALESNSSVFDNSNCKGATIQQWCHFEDFPLYFVLKIDPPRDIFPTQAVWVSLSLCQILFEGESYDSNVVVLPWEELTCYFVPALLYLSNFRWDPDHCQWSSSCNTCQLTCTNLSLPIQQSVTRLHWHLFGLGSSSRLGSIIRDKSLGFRPSGQLIA